MSLVVRHNIRNNSFIKHAFLTCPNDKFFKSCVNIAMSDRVRLTQKKKIVENKTFKLIYLILINGTLISSYNQSQNYTF